MAIEDLIKAARERLRDESPEGAVTPSPPEEDSGGGGGSPGSKRYEVKPGDSAASIAAEVYSDPRLYIEALEQGAIGRVRPGDVLQLPSEEELRARSRRELREPGEPSRIKTEEERARDIAALEEDRDLGEEVLGLELFFGGGDEEFFQDRERIRQFVEEQRELRRQREGGPATRRPGDRLYAGVIYNEEGEVEDVIATTQNTGIPLYYYYDGESSRLTPEQTNIPAIAGMVTKGGADLTRAEVVGREEAVQAGIIASVALSERELETIGRQMQAEARVGSGVAETEEERVNQQIENMRIIQQLRQREAQLAQQLEEAVAEAEQVYEEGALVRAGTAVQAEEALARAELDQTQDFIERIEREQGRINLEDYEGDPFTFTFGDQLDLGQWFQHVWDETLKKRFASPIARKIPLLGPAFLTGVSLAGPAARGVWNRGRLKLNQARAALNGVTLHDVESRDFIDRSEEQLEENAQQLSSSRQELLSINQQIEEAEGSERLQLLRRRSQLQRGLMRLEQKREIMQDLAVVRNDIMQQQAQVNAVWSYWAASLQEDSGARIIASGAIPLLEKVGLEPEQVSDFLRVLVDATNEYRDLLPAGVRSPLTDAIPPVELDDVFEGVDDHNLVPRVLQEEAGLTDEEAHLLQYYTSPRTGAPLDPLAAPEAMQKAEEAENLRRQMQRDAAAIRARDIPQLIEMGNREQARERMFTAIALELEAATWHDPEFAYTWVTHPERQMPFLEAWTEAEVQKYAQSGEYLTNQEIFKLKEQFMDPFNEMASEIVTEAVLFLPDKAWETVISGAWGALKVGGSAVFDVLRKVRPIGWALEQSSRSVAHGMGTSFTDATRLLGRRGAVRTVGQGDSMVETMKTAARYSLAESDEAAAEIAEELPRIGNTWLDQLRETGRVFDEADPENIHPSRRSLVDSVRPQNWGDTVREIQSEIYNAVAQNIREARTPDVVAGRMTQSELDELIRREARKAADNPKRIAPYFGDRVNDAYIALRTPVEAGTSGVLEDSLTYQLYRGARWFSEDILGQDWSRAPDASRFLTSRGVGYLNALRNLWVGLVLSARVGWTMINLQDSVGRYLLEGESIFDDFFSILDSNYDRAMRNGVTPEELMQAFQRYDLERSQDVGRRLLRGEKPRAGPLGFISYEWKRLAEETPGPAFTESPLGWAAERVSRGAKAWMGGWHDTNSAIEFVLRLRMFSNKYADNFLRADAAALSRWQKQLARMNLSDEQRRFLLDLWAQSEDNPERMRQIMRSLVEGRDTGNPLWTVFIPPDMRAKLKGLTPVERMTVTRHVNRSLRNITARATAEGRHVRPEEINELFNRIIRSVREELADVSSDARRHTIREAREVLSGDPDFDARVPDVDDIDTSSARSPRRAIEVAREQPTERAVEELSTYQNIQAALDDADTFVQRVADSTDPFAKVELDEGVEGLIETVVDPSTGRATIRMNPDILNRPVEQVRDLVSGEVRGILEIEDRILINHWFDDAADYRTAVDNFLDDPQALKESDPRAFKFVATQLDASPDHARVLEALSQKKLTGLLDPDDVLLDATSDAGRSLHNLSERDLYGEWGKKVGPHPGYYRAGQRSMIARGRFNSLANELEITGEVVGESAAAVMGNMDRRIGEVRDRLFEWIYHSWPGPASLQHGPRRGDAWEKAFRLKERIYNGSARWFDELTEKATRAGSLEELRALDSEISVAELMNRSGFGLSLDDELISIRGARGVGIGSSSVRAVGGLIDVIPGVRQWEDLFRPYREVLEEAQRAKPGTHMQSEAQEVVRAIREPVEDAVEEAVEEAAPRVVESNRVMESYSRARIRSGFKSWGLTSDQADGVMTVLDGHATVYAQYTGRSKADFYLRNWGDVVVGGEPAADALFQRGQSLWNDYLNEYTRHYDEGAWVGGINLEEGAQVGPVPPVGWASTPEELSDSLTFDISLFLDPEDEVRGLWHVTSNRKGVLSKGLKAGEEVGQMALGGGGKGVSVTYSARHADRIEQRMFFIAQVAQGEKSIDDILKEAENWYAGDFRPRDAIDALQKASAALDGSDVRNLFHDLQGKIKQAVLDAGYQMDDPAAWRIVEDWLDDFITTPHEKFSFARHLDTNLLGKGDDLVPIGISSEFEQFSKIDPDGIQKLRVVVDPETPPPTQIVSEWELQFDDPSRIWVAEDPGAAIPSPNTARRVFETAAQKGLSADELLIDGDIQAVVNRLAGRYNIPVDQAIDEIIAAAGGPEDMLELYQRRMGGEGIAGATEFMEDGRAILRGFEDANVSTALHESNHVFVRTLQRISDESDLARRDLKIMEDFLEEEVGLTKAAGEWTEEMHEEIARRYERYFRDGEAPSPELEGLFERFRQWMTDIYDRLRGTPLYGKSVEGTDLQEVFDRWTRAAVPSFEQLDEADKALRMGRAIEAGALDTLPTNARLAVEDQARFMKKQALESHEGRRIPVEGQDAPEVESSTRPDWYRLLRYGTDHDLTPAGIASRWTGDRIPEYKKGGLAGDIADSIDRMLAGEPPANILDERVRQVVALELGSKTDEVPGVEALPNFAYTVAVEGPEAALEEARRFLEDNPEAAESPEDLIRLFHGEDVDLAQLVEGPPPVRQTVLDTPVTEMDDPKLAETVKMEARWMLDDIWQDRPALWRDTTQLSDEEIVEQLDNIHRGVVPEENVKAYQRVRELIDYNLESGVISLETDEFLRAGHPHYHRLAGTPDDQVESMVRMWDEMDESPPSIEEYLRARMESDEFDDNAKAMWETFVLANGLDNWGDDVVTSPDQFRAFLTAKIEDMAAEGYDEWAPEVMEAMDLLRQKVDNYMSLRSDWGWALGLEPSQIRAARMGRPTIPVPEWNMPRPFRKWLQNIQTEQAKANRVLTAMDDWRNWLVGQVEDGDALFNLREMPLDELERMVDAAEVGSRLKDDAVNVSIHGDTEDVFPELGKGLEDYRFGHKGMTGALEETNWAMLDYTQYSNIDNVMRNIIPFWMFPSRSIPYWIETLTRHPRIAAMYYRYQGFSRRLAYQEGAVMSNGEQLPSLEGYIPVPGTDMWFNLAAPLSARYVTELAGHYASRAFGLRRDRGSFDEQTEEQPMISQMMRHALEAQRLYGIYFGPWVSLPLYGLNNQIGGDLHEDFPAFSVVPQMDLIPVWWQRSLLDGLNRATGGLSPETLSPQVAWKDYLIEREMLEMVLEQVQSGELTDAEAQQLISDAKAALGYRRVPNEDDGGAGFELMPREDHPLWQRAQRQVEQRDLYTSWIGYFTGVYPKEHTDARAALLQVRDDINRIRDSLNNEFAADLFLPYQDAEQMWDFYTNRAYDTNEGAVAGLYGSISWTQLPGGEQAYGLDRRQIVAANLHRETMTDQYYAALLKYIEERNESLKTVPIGDRERRNEIWARYFRNFDLIDSQPQFEIVRRDWISGNKPSELLQEEFRNRFFYMIRSTRPGFRERGHSNETYNTYLERLDEWEEELPHIAQQWVNHFVSVEGAVPILGERQKLMKVDGIWTYRPDPDATPRRIIVPEDLEIFGDKLVRLQDMAQSFADELDAESLEEWDKMNDTPGDALNKAWQELVWDPYWDIFEQGNRFGNEIAEREFLEYEGQLTMDDYIDWVLEEYPNRGWTREDLLEWAKGGIQPLEEEIAPEDETAQMEDEIWDVLLMIGPDDEEFKNELDEIMDFGSSRLNVWYENQAQSFKNEESFAEFHEAVMTVASNLDLDSPDRQTLMEWNEAKRLNDALQHRLESRYGPAFVREVMVPYWRLDPIFDKEDREEMREAEPRIEEYNEIKEEFARSNPIYAKYYMKHIWEELQEEEEPGKSGTSSGGGRESTSQRQGGSSSGGGVTDGGPTETAPEAPAYFPLGFRGGTAGQPMWPEGSQRILGQSATTAIRRMFEERAPLPDFTIEFLKGVAERHPEYQEWAAKIIAISQALARGEQVTLNFEDIEFLG